MNKRLTKQNLINALEYIPDDVTVSLKLRFDTLIRTQKVMSYDAESYNFSLCDQLQFDGKSVIIGLCIDKDVSEKSIENRESLSTPGDEETGVVKFFNDRKGYGFIIDGKGRDLFMHYHDIVGSGWRSMVAGELVTFRSQKTNKGWLARDIRRVNENEIINEEETEQTDLEP